MSGDLMGAGAAPLTMATSMTTATAAVGAASASAAIAGAATATTAVATSPIWAPVVTGAAVFAAVAAVAAGTATFLQFACETQDSMDAKSASADPVPKNLRQRNLQHATCQFFQKAGLRATTALFSNAPCTLCGRRGTYGTGLALVAHLVPICRHGRAGVAFGSIDLHSVWQAWYLAQVSWRNCLLPHMAHNNFTQLFHIQLSHT